MVRSNGIYRLPDDIFSIQKRIVDTVLSMTLYERAKVITRAVIRFL